MLQTIYTELLSIYALVNATPVTVAKTLVASIGSDYRPQSTSRV